MGMSNRWYSHFLVKIRVELWKLCKKNKLKIWQVRSLNTFCPAIVTTTKEIPIKTKYSLIHEFHWNPSKNYDCAILQIYVIIINGLQPISHHTARLTARQNHWEMTTLQIHEWRMIRVCITIGRLARARNICNWAQLLMWVYDSSIIWWDYYYSTDIWFDMKEVILLYLWTIRMSNPIR